MLPIRTSRNLSKKNLLLTFLFCLLGLYATSVNAGQGSLTLGIHPYRSVTDLYKRFTPLADYLGKKVGQPVTIKIARDYHEHIDQVSKDKVDIAFIGPVPYVTMVDIGGKKPILWRVWRSTAKPHYRE
ncbi:MAG: PhnD/SsuA/transferrin family substrate-binding protein [Deltaproteobacteria bacterium]|nr:PhnD/SsuA/transferrin family substrate-binding protein [Deltaproteobacteria bacterium]